TGELYGSTGNSPAASAIRSLVKIDPATGRVSVVGPYNVAAPSARSTMSDLSFDPTTGILYGMGSVGGPNIFTINTATGAATVVGSNGPLTSTTGGGIAFNAAGQAY